MASRTDWDARHRETEPSLGAPDPLLLEARQFVPWVYGRVSRALDVACGRGRHAVCLADWGFETLAVDFSAEALRRCTEHAVAAGVDLETRALDLEAPDIDLGTGCFDLVAVFNFLHRPAIPALKRCVRAGGLIVYKTYTLAQRELAGGPSNPDYLLRPNELRDLFSEFEILLYREKCELEATASLVARRA